MSEMQTGKSAIELQDPSFEIGGEAPEQFEQRKLDHLRLALENSHQTSHLSGFENIEFIHEALPELNFEDVTLQTESLGMPLPTPLLVSSMTAGHAGGVDLNLRLAQACDRRGWMMGVGSQRRELFDPAAAVEWRELRKLFPQVKLLGNIGLSQLISASIEQVERLVESLEASAMIVHTNPLQEVLQIEGTPQFKGGLEALEKIAKSLSVPVVLK
ncbi:MAG: alpha-hydroxy-acid oxidizing protein, partial [Bdellovibrionales bacterium]|nr:alpha-hydroxy-acid oxidizing protein [Bdellovibrionales bacterium]